MKDCFVFRIGNPYYNVLLDVLKNKCASSCILNVTAYSDLGLILSKTKFQPAYSNHYLLIAEIRTKKDWQTLKTLIFPYLEIPFIKVVILTIGSDLYDLVISQMSNHNFVVHNYDTYKLDNSVKSKYILTKIKELNPECKIYKNALSTLLYRLRGYSLDVDMFLQRLSLSSEITVKLVQDTVPIKETVNTLNFANYLFSGVELKKALQVVERYRFSTEYLLQSVHKYIETLIDFYWIYSSGEFNDITFDDWYLAHKGDAKYSVTSEYQLKTILNLLHQFTLPTLLILLDLSTSNNKNYTQKIIDIYKVCVIVSNNCKEE